MNTPNDKVSKIVEANLASWRETILNNDTILSSKKAEKLMIEEQLAPLEKKIEEAIAKAIEGTNYDELKEKQTTIDDEYIEIKTLQDISKGKIFWSIMDDITTVFNLVTFKEKKDIEVELLNIFRAYDIIYGGDENLYSLIASGAAKAVYKFCKDFWSKKYLYECPYEVYYSDIGKYYIKNILDDDTTSFLKIPESVLHDNKQFLSLLKTLETYYETLNDEYLTAKEAKEKDSKMKEEETLYKQYLELKARFEGKEDT